MSSIIALVKLYSKNGGMFTKEECELVTMKEMKFKAKPTSNLTELQCLLFKNLFSVVNSDGHIG